MAPHKLPTGIGRQGRPQVETGSQPVEDDKLRACRYWDLSCLFTAKAASRRARSPCGPPATRGALSTEDSSDSRARRFGRPFQRPLVAATRAPSACRPVRWLPTPCGSPPSSAASQLPPLRLSRGGDSLGRYGRLAGSRPPRPDRPARSPTRRRRALGDRLNSGPRPNGCAR